MPHLDLTDEEEAVLAVELVQLISRAKYPFSDRVRTLGAIQAGASPTDGLAGAEGLCAAVEGEVPRRRTD